MAESQGALSNISQISTMATAEIQSVKRKLPNECDNWLLLNCAPVRPGTPLRAPVRPNAPRAKKYKEKL